MKQDTSDDSLLIHWRALSGLSAQQKSRPGRHTEDSAGIILLPALPLAPVRLALVAAYDGELWMMHQTSKRFLFLLATIGRKQIVT